MTDLNLACRHKYYLHCTKDSHAAALLVVAEQIEHLVHLLTAPVENVITETPVVEHHEIAAPVPPLPPIDIEGVEFIRTKYVKEMRPLH